MKKVIAITVDAFSNKAVIDLAMELKEYDAGQCIITGVEVRDLTTSLYDPTNG